MQLDFEESEYSIEEIENKYKEAQSEWRVVVENRKKLREEELLDKNTVVIEGEDNKAQIKRRKIIKKLHKNETRKRSFKYITKYLGKDKNKSLNRVQVKNEEGDIVKTIYNWKEMENALIEHNKMHYRKAHKSIAHRDKIYNKLTCDKTRDKILNGTLSKDDCQYQAVYNFLTLL